MTSRRLPTTTKATNKGNGRKAPRAKARTALTEAASKIHRGNGLHPEFWEASDRYWRDLPELLKTKSGLWVAYTAQGLFAEGNSELELYQFCDREELTPGHYLVTRVEPDLPVCEIRDNWYPPIADAT